MAAYTQLGSLVQRLGTVSGTLLTDTSLRMMDTVFSGLLDTSQVAMIVMMIMMMIIMILSGCEAGGCCLSEKNLHRRPLRVDASDRQMCRVAGQLQILTGERKNPFL